MTLPPNVPKSAIDKYVPIKLISESPNGLIIAAIPNNIVKPTPSSLLALRIPRSREEREALLRQIESLLSIKTRRVTRVIDYDPRGNWYVTSFCHGRDLQHLKENFFQDGFPPFLICKIFDEVMAAQSTELEPKGICHTNLKGSNIILTPTEKEEFPIVRIVHLHGVMTWDEQAVVKQMIGLLRYLTNSASRIPEKYRMNKKRDKLEDLIEDEDTNSLIIGDDFYSFIANYDLEGNTSWEELKSRWMNEATALMKELFNSEWLLDVMEIIMEPKVTDDEFREAVEDGGMDIIDDRNL
jgi:serine/threonine protein kinase